MSTITDLWPSAYIWPTAAAVAFVGCLCALMGWLFLKSPPKHHQWPKDTVFLLVTAHPDDECMFFGPTLLNLVRANCVVHLLCFSSGNFAHLGSRRKRELFLACRVLGIPDSRVHVVDSPLIADHPTNPWNCDLLVCILKKHVEQLHITVILSFDGQGVSGHLNHISVSNGCRLFKQVSTHCVSVCMLNTVCTVRKYLAFVETLLPVCSGNACSQLRYVSSIRDVHRICVAMSKHKSQLVWFRVLYLLFSRYVFLNEYLPVQQ